MLYLRKKEKIFILEKITQNQDFIQ